MVSGQLLLRVVLLRIRDVPRRVSLLQDGILRGTSIAGVKGDDQGVGVGVAVETEITGEGENIGQDHSHHQGIDIMTDRNTMTGLGVIGQEKVHFFLHIWLLVQW